MKSAPLPPDEPERLEALRETRTLDTAPEEVFDQLTAMAARLCGAPTALITLVDVDRQWFKSSHGLDLDISETPRDVAFCAHTILEDDLLVVEDAARDERFADNPLVTAEPRIRFYAGSPLVTGDGHAIGSFCVLDQVPHRITEAHRRVLRTLARHVSALLEQRRAEARLEHHAKRWERAGESGDSATRIDALAELGRELRRRVAERDRSEAALRDLEQELAALRGPSEKSASELARAIEGPLAELAEALPSRDVLGERLGELRDAARRLREVIEDSAEHSAAGGSGSSGGV